MYRLKTCATLLQLRIISPNIQAITQNTIYIENYRIEVIAETKAKSGVFQRHSANAV